MIRSRLILAAEAVIRDVRTDAISVFNIIESMVSPGFPLFVPQITILSIIDRDADDPSDIEVEVVLRLDGRQLGRQSMAISFADKLRNRQIVQFGGLPLPAPGLLTISILHQDRLIHEYVIPVEAIGSATIQTLQV